MPGIGMFTQDDLERLARYPVISPEAFRAILLNPDAVALLAQKLLEEKPEELKLKKLERIPRRYLERLARGETIDPEVFRAILEDSDAVEQLAKLVQEHSGGAEDDLDLSDLPEMNVSLEEIALFLEGKLEASDRREAVVEFLRAYFPEALAPPPEGAVVTSFPETTTTPAALQRLLGEKRKAAAELQPETKSQQEPTRARATRPRRRLVDWAVAAVILVGVIGWLSLDRARLSATSAQKDNTIHSLRATLDHLQREVDALQRKLVALGHVDLAEVVSPKEGEEVGQHYEEVEGRLNTPEGWPVILVRAVHSDHGWYIQPKVEEVKDGKFTAVAFFGSPGHPAGTKFQIAILLAKNKEEAHKYEQDRKLISLPVGLTLSKPVTVSRK